MFLKTRNVFIYITMILRQEGKQQMNSKPKGKFNKKLLAAIAIIIIVIAAAAVVFEYTLLQPQSNLPAMTLTVVGADGQHKELNQKDIASLESYTANGGFKSSGGMIAAVGEYTGVPILTLCDLVGGISSDQTLTVTASDGYSMVYTYNQVNGKDFTTYDPVTGSEATSTQPMKMVATYLKDGAALPSDEGPLRIGVLGSEGLLTEGHFWTKMVSKIEVTANVQDWTVTVKATTDLDMNRQSFTADLNHFGVNYTDSSGNVWTGTALWRWVSWSNYNGGVSNASLDQGYSVKIVSGDGSSATFDDSEVKMNDDIIVAAKLNGAALADPYWPLTMVGPDVPSAKMIKNIVEIQIILDSHATSPTPTASPIASPSPTASPSPSPTPVSWNLIVNGTTAVTMTKAQFEDQVSGSTQTYTDSSTTWVGTPLHRLVVWAQNNGAISSSALTSGYVVKVIGTDGYTKAFNDTRIDMNTNIIVANQANGTALSGIYSPLTLTGSELSGKEKVKGIAQIQIIPISHIQLTLVASNGTQVNLFSNDLLELPAYAANGGTRSSGGTLANFGTYTGVPILTLCNLVGGVTSSNTVKITGSDNFTSTLTFAQVNAQGIATYDSTGAQVTPTQPITMIVAYYVNGTSIPADPGPLRIMFVGTEGLYTPGSLNARLVVKVEIL
jgi:DMSO/TMAO reductase YedYZ molybdopterin-dependent catalytic subunit